MIVYIDANERFPDISISNEPSDNPYGMSIEVTKEEYERILAAEREYDAVQQLLNDKMSQWRMENKK
jgi:hypothetical protein